MRQKVPLAARADFCHGLVGVDQRQELSREISGSDLSYQELKELAKELFPQSREL